MISRTKILTLIVFGLLFLKLSAQGDFENDPVAKLPDDNRTFRFGLHFSPNLSWFKTNKTGFESGGSKMGFSYGVSFEYFLTNNYLISSGVGILNSGGIVKNNTDTLFEVVEDFKVKYIEIPALLKLRTNEIGYFTYYGQFGLMTGFNFSSSSTFEYNSKTTTGFNLTPTTTPTTTGINFINMSMAIGLGVEYNISGNTSLNLGLTFYNGFIDQLDNNANANLNYLTLNIGIYF